MTNLPEPGEPWGCGNCGTCENRCVQRLSSELYDAGHELVERRCLLECNRAARWVRNAGYILLGMTVDPLCRLLSHWWPWLLNAIPPMWEIALWGGQGLLLLAIAPWYERILRNRWSPSRG